jgi:uncharacterized protein YuzE
LAADDDIFIEVDSEGNIIDIEIWRASTNILENLTDTISKKLRKQMVTT